MSNTAQDSSGLEPLLSIEGARAVLGVSVATMARILRGGELPTLYIGRRRLVDPADLREFIEVRRGHEASDAS